jgi:hypothetical protein
MAQVAAGPWAFDVPPGAAVVTSSYVLRRDMPILDVTHGTDAADEVTWQFHCGNGDYSMSVLRLVRLDEILAIDGTVASIANLPIGHCATREAVGGPWTIKREEEA